MGGQELFLSDSRGRQADEYKSGAEYGLVGIDNILSDIIKAPFVLWQKELFNFSP